MEFLTTRQRGVEEAVVVFTHPRAAAGESDLHPGLDSAVLDHVEEAEQSTIREDLPGYNGVKSSDGGVGTLVHDEAPAKVGGFGQQFGSVHRDGACLPVEAPVAARAFGLHAQILTEGGQSRQLLQFRDEPGS